MTAMTAQAPGTERAMPLTIEEVIRQTQRPLLSFLVRLLSDPEEAMDILQETYIKSLSQPGFLDSGFNQRAWLYRVSGNLAKSTLRRIRRLFRFHPEPMEIPAPLEQVLASEAAQGVQAGLSKLSFTHRQILLLRYYMDMSYADIASVLDVPIGTVMSRLNRAKAELERSLS
jgi:RNA polymerase sigma-70 factor (ECF subfamily)